MADKLSKEARSELMSRVRTKHTSPEMLVRRKLHKQGFRFRLHRNDLPGKPDIVLPRHKIAVFVNGCFWHGHQCPKGRLPSTNRKFWEDKLARNAERDHRVQLALAKTGWIVRVIWECDTLKGVGELMDELSTELPPNRPE